MAAPTVIEEFELLPDGRYAITDTLAVDIGNTIVDLETQVKVLKEKNATLQDALASERAKVNEIEESFEDFKVAQEQTIKLKDKRIDNLLEIVNEYDNTFKKLEQEHKIEKLKWAGGGTLAGAFVGWLITINLLQGGN